jgi:hypothetical protein
MPLGSSRRSGDQPRAQLVHPGNAAQARGQAVFRYGRGYRAQLLLWILESVFGSCVYNVDPRQEDNMMYRISAATLSVFVLFSTAAGAQPATQSSADKPCLRIGQIYSFAPIKGNDSAMVVTDNAHHRFKLTFTSFCSGLDYNIGVTINSHGLGRLSCVAHGDEVISKDPGSANHHCPVANVELYTAAMEKADMAAAAAMKH